jgi:flagellin-like protein
VERIFRNPKEGKRNKLKFRKFRKNAKALSPVIATIILIAVTVAVSVVVAAWMGALTIGFMGNAEQASITNTVFNSNTQVAVTVQNTGSATVTISSVTIDGQAVPAAQVTGPANNAIAKGNSGTFTISLPAGTGSGAITAFANTAQYTIKLMTAKGNTVVTQATYTGS